ncbi:hypothetical protein C8R43DRAFT_820449, partial [Mycena crocata]
PEWAEGLRSAHAYLSEKDWGAKWQALLTSTINFERSHGHVNAPTEQKTLQYNLRPWEIPQWMKEHRRPVDFDVSDSKEGEFGERMLAWWKSMSGLRRFDKEKVGEGGFPDATDLGAIDWIKVDVPGRNGVLTIVLGLAWW